MSVCLFIIVECGVPLAHSTTHDIYNVERLADRTGSSFLSILLAFSPAQSADSTGKSRFNCYGEGRSVRIEQSASGCHDDRAIGRREPAQLLDNLRHRGASKGDLFVRVEAPKRKAQTAAGAMV